MNLRKLRSCRGLVKPRGRKRRQLKASCFEDSLVSKHERVITDPATDFVVNYTEAKYPSRLSCEGAAEDQCLSLRPLMQKSESVELNGIQVLPLTPDRLHVVLGIPAEHDSIKVSGLGHVTALKGNVTILGHTLTPLCIGEKFYAPATTCALVFETFSNDQHNDVKIHNIWNDLTVEDEALRKETEGILVRYEVVLLLSSTDDSTMTFPGYPDLYNIRQSDGEVERELNYGAYIVKTERFFHLFPAYVSAYNQIENYTCGTENIKIFRMPIILAIGGKGTGKSTLNRYLVNKLLQKFSKIEYVECDMGQPEFGPSGFISVTSVSLPLLGPPFTHATSPRFSVYHGNLNAMSQPIHYIESIQSVLDQVNTTKCPVIVNTMGWNRGLGLNLLVDILRIVCPTHVLQLSSENESKNLPLLTHDYVRLCEGFCSTLISPVRNFHHMVLNVDLKPQEVSYYSSVELRTLRMLTYLTTMGKDCSKRENNVKTQRPTLATLCLVKPYRVKLCDVLLCVTHESGVPCHLGPGLFNSNLAGLCVVSNSYFEQNRKTAHLRAAPVCECLGVGLVRGIDNDKECLYIVSHLSEDNLKRVNCLILGLMSIPECFCKDGGTTKENEVKLSVVRSVYILFTPPRLCPIMSLKAFLRASQVIARTPYVSIDFPFDISGSGKFRVYRSFVKGE